MKIKLDHTREVVDINQPFQKVEPLQILYSKETKKYIVSPRFPTEESIETELNKYKGKLIPLHLPYYYGELTKQLQTIRLAYFDSFKHISSYIGSSNQKNREAKNLIDKLAKPIGLTKKQLEILLKLLVARSFIVMIKKGSKYYFKLNKEEQKQEDRIQFLSTIIEEVKAKSKRIGLLINHHATVGNYRENLLISVIKKYLPNQFEISSGFIEHNPRQYDVIIFDSSNYIPLFNEANIVVVKQESVRAVIEVKTTLTTNKLDESLGILNDIGKYQIPIIPIFKGIFSFNTDYKTSDSIAKRVKDFYNKVEKGGYQFNRLNHPFQKVDCICIQNGFFIYSNNIGMKEKEDSQTMLSSLEPKYQNNQAGAAFLSRLFQFLDVNEYSKDVNSSFFVDLFDQVSSREIVKIHRNDWMYKHQSIGSKTFMGPIDYKKRTTDCLDWLQNKTSTKELVKIYS